MVLIWNEIVKPVSINNVDKPQTRCHTPACAVKKQTDGIDNIRKNNVPHR
jgi:hypothetical protein